MEILIIVKFGSVKNTFKHLNEYKQVYIVVLVQWFLRQTSGFLNFRYGQISSCLLNSSKKKKKSLGEGDKKS